MLIHFQGDYGNGIPALLVGSVAALSAGRYYWRVNTGRYANSDGETGTAEADEL